MSATFKAIYLKLVLPTCSGFCKYRTHMVTFPTTTSSKVKNYTCVSRLQAIWENNASNVASHFLIFKRVFDWYLLNYTDFAYVTSLIAFEIEGDVISPDRHRVHHLECFSARTPYCFVQGMTILVIFFQNYNQFRPKMPR